MLDMKIVGSGRAFLVLACLSSVVSATPLDRRIVDRVIVGDTKSEGAHAYAADRDTTGVDHGHAFRSARGWLRYALSVFDDTEVTIACIFARTGTHDRTGGFDLLIENQVVASYEYGPPSTLPDTLEVRVPIGLTRGRTNILVILRATMGATPPLLELRTVQDHNE